VKKFSYVDLLAIFFLLAAASLITGKLYSIWSMSNNFGQM
jgi:hypothetical protein